MPRVPCPSRRPSVRPARSHSLPEERLLPDPLRHPPLPGVSLFRSFRCYLDRPPASHSSLPHPSPSGVSLFRSFRCYLDRPPASHSSLPHPPPPGMSLFRRFRCYLDRPHARHGPLRHPPPSGVSRFRRFRCYLDRPHARHGPPRHPPSSGVSLFRRIGSHLRRVTRHPARHYGSGRPGTGSLLRCFCVEQEAARPRCALKTGISFAKTRRFRAADYSPRPAPARGTFTVAWNIAVRTRGVFSHRAGFQKLACAKRGLVRTSRPRLPIRYRKRPRGVRKAYNIARNCTGWRGGEAACGSRWR